MAPDRTSKPELRFNGPKNAKWRIVLDHGAGAGMDTPFMTAVAEGLALAGVRVARFEFPYKAEARRTGRKRPPDRKPMLRDTWLQVVAMLGRECLVIGLQRGCSHAPKTPS